MKLLIFIEDNLFYRNFVKSGAFDDVCKKHDVRFAYAHNPGAFKFTVSQDIEKEGLKILGRFQYPKNRVMQIHNFTVLNMVKLRHKSRTFMTRCRHQLSFAKHLFYKILSWDIFYDRYKQFFIKKIGIYEPIRKILELFYPDLVIVPTSLIDSISIDAILCSRQLKVKTLLLINSWDNLSSKGTIPYMPDYLGVWGEQCKRHAVEIHDMPSERVAVLGCAQFQRLYQASGLDRMAFRKSNNLPLQKKIILFAGSARVFDETAVLIELENAIEKGELGGVHILYRPHPWRHRRIGEDSVFQYSFKHVTLDPSLAESYKKHKEDSTFLNLPSTVLPDLSYYPKLYNSVDAVICALTTIMAEAAISGIPSLAIAFNDGKHVLTMDKLIHDEHFEKIISMRGIIICKDRKDFIRDVIKLILLSEDSGMKAALKEEIRYVVYSDKRTYSQRLADLVDSIGWDTA